MGTRSRPSSALYALVLLVSSLLAVPSAPARQPADPTPYEPPVFSFEGGRIDLMEAIRLTLQYDPNLLLAEEDTNLRAGVVQEFAGAFDWTLSGRVQYLHREQELSESAQRSERKKRAQLDLAANDPSRASLGACPGQAAQEQRLAQLLAALDHDGSDRFSFPDPTSDPTDAGVAFALQLHLLETLIQTNSDPTVVQGLVDERRRLLDDEIAATRARLFGTGDRDGLVGACQSLNEQLALLGDVPEEEEFDQAQLQLRLEKLTRTGILLSPFLTGDFSATEFVGKRSGRFVIDEFSPSGIPIETLVDDRGGKNVRDSYSFEVGFDVNIPLLRNRGRLAVAGPEIAAGIDYDASELTLAHAASESALTTATAFWGLIAAQERVAVLETSVGLQGQVVDITRRLIEADELPAAESARGLAAAANARAQLESARRDLISAKVSLVRAMGLSVESQQNIPNGEGGFPPAPSRADIERLMEAELVRLGIVNRLDLQSARKLQESGGVLAGAARINLKPRLNLLGAVSAIGRGEETLSNSTDEFKAPSFRVGTQFELPVGNNQQEGRLLQAEARARQGEIGADDLERQVRLEVVRTLGSLIDAIDALAQAEAAGQSFERTVNAEIQKLRLGEATQLDAVLTEQQRTQALLGVVAARQQLANLLSQLRFETGTLVDREADENRITWESLTTLPGSESGS